MSGVGGTEPYLDRFLRLSCGRGDEGEDEQ